MDKEAKLVQLLRDFRKQPPHFHFAEVTEITGETCSIKIGDLALTDVRLMASAQKSTRDGLLVIPKVGSLVLVADDHEVGLRSLFVVKVDDPEKIIYTHKDTSIEIDADAGTIVINGGDLGGLIKIEELVNRLNAIEDYVKNFKSIYNTHTHTDPISGSTGAPSATVLLDPETTQRDPLEDTKVKH